MIQTSATLTQSQQAQEISEGADVLLDLQTGTGDVAISPFLSILQFWQRRQGVLAKTSPRHHQKTHIC